MDSGTAEQRRCSTCQGRELVSRRSFSSELLQRVPHLSYPALQLRVCLVPQPDKPAVRLCGGVADAGRLVGATQCEQRERLVQGQHVKTVGEPANSFRASVRPGSQTQGELEPGKCGLLVGRG